MSNDVKTKTIPLYINSEDRDPNRSESESNFVITFHKTLRNVRRIDICSVEIPRSWYNVDETNNTVMVAAKIGGINIFTYTSTPPGNYNVELFRSTMQTVLNNMGFGTWTVTFDEFTYKYTITAAALGFSFRILNSGSLNEMLGFKNTPNYFSNSVTSDSLVDVQHHRFLFIKSRTLANNINTSYVSSFKKAWIIKSGVNDTFVITTAGGTFSWTIPVLGSYTTEQLMEIMAANFIVLPGFAGSTAWNFSIDYDTKMVTISNQFVPFYVHHTDTLATFAFNWDTSITTLKSMHKGRRIDFSMHQNVVRKVLIANTEFATEKIYDTRTFDVENDYGSKFNIDSIDFSIVDAQDREINLNGKGISFTLLVSSNN